MGFANELWNLFPPEPPRASSEIGEVVFYVGCGNLVGPWPVLVFGVSSKEAKGVLQSVYGRLFIACRMEGNDEAFYGFPDGRICEKFVG